MKISRKQIMQVISFYHETEGENVFVQRQNLRGCRRYIVILVRLRVGDSVDNKYNYSAGFIR